jgi:hypothetical protein
MARKKSAKHAEAASSNALKKLTSKSSSNLIMGLSIIISITAIALLLYLSFLHSDEDTVISNYANKTTEERQAAFLQWIVDNGGIFHPIRHGDQTLAVTLEKFPQFGGWGLALSLDTEQQCFNSTDGQCQLSESEDEDSNETIVHQLDPLFTIPSSLIITVPKILEMYGSISSDWHIPSFHSRLDTILRKGLHGNGLSKQINMMGLVEQDVVMALYLMAENCQHEHLNLFGKDSFYGPYLDVLPGLIPRLDTFGDEEYNVLKDKVLEQIGRESKRALEEMYSGPSDRKGGSLKAVLLDMIATKINTGSSSLEKASCTSFESFHRFIALISSRAMVLRGEKRVVPLAEMINYAPLPEVSSNIIRPAFDLFHSLGEDGSMTVRSDRDVILSSGVDNLVREDGSTVVQLFEDYGPVDSSLFLEAHGFVPNDNPHHCVVIPGPLIERAVAPNGIKEADKQFIVDALQMLRLAPAKLDTSRPLLQDFCVRQDLSLVEDGSDNVRRPASDAIAVVSLLASNDEDQRSLREQCTSAINSSAHEMIEIRCARYPENDAIIKGALNSAAGFIVKEGNSNTDSEDSEKTDAESTRLVSNLLSAEAEGLERMALAWRFRVQERRLLLSIAYSTEELLDQNEEKISPSNDELDEKLREFNSFIESLHLPVNKLEARIVGDGVRVGTFAKEGIDEGEIYISLPENTTIDYDHAIKDAHPNLKQLLKKYHGSDRDGFMALLIYLVYERFVMKEQSKWWPYLNLLPTIDDVKRSHPLFYAETDINQYLGGSHARQVLLRYRQGTNQKHAALASDLDAHLVLGSENLLNKDAFRWASAIIDSRSIWWGNKRHLAPLLDLVNADSVGKPHGTQIEGQGIENRAVTRASRHVKKGDQLFENYAQPNHLLFTYHGFILEDNPDDCALTRISIDGRAPLTFCIKDWDSLEEMAHVLRVKYHLRLTPDQGKSEDVRPYLIQELKQRISQLKAFVYNDNDVSEKGQPYHIHCMQTIVKNDIKHFENALALVTEAT